MKVKNENKNEKKTKQEEIKWNNRRWKENCERKNFWNRRWNSLKTKMWVRKL